MKLKIESDLLLKGLEPLAIVIKEKNIIPILECVHIEFTGDKIIFTGNNCEIGCVKTVDFKSDIKIAACVKYSLLSEMLKNIKSQELEIIFDDNQIQIIHSKGDFKLPKFNGDDFVFMENDTMDLSAKINGKKLKSSLKVANKFILDDEMEPMSNVVLCIDSKKTVVKSTNRATLFEEQIKGKGDEKNLLLSAISSVCLSSLISDEDVIFKYNDNLIYIEDGDKRINIVQQNGEFPVAMFDRIIATLDGGSILTIDNEELKSSLRRIVTLSDHQHGNLVKFSLLKDSLKINCDNTAFSTSAKENMSSKFDKEIEIGFNAKILIEILNVFGDDVELSFTEMNQLGLKNKKKRGFLAPMKL